MLFKFFLIVLPLVFVLLITSCTSKRYVNPCYQRPEAFLDSIQVARVHEISDSLWQGTNFRECAVLLVKFPPNENWKSDSLYKLTPMVSHFRTSTFILSIEGKKIYVVGRYQ